VLLGAAAAEPRYSEGDAKNAKDANIAKISALGKLATFDLAAQ